jgi:hypothetical protein
MQEDWSESEVAAVVEDYFDMLAAELRGRSFNKAEHNRQLQKKLENRGRGSVEYKHRNISAVLGERGLAYINGYKPLHNYQASLKAAVEDYLARYPKFFAKK